MDFFKVSLKSTGPEYGGRIIINFSFLSKADQWICISTVSTM